MSTLSRTIGITAATALLLATQGPLSAQQPPAPVQAPQASPTTSDDDSDDRSRWEEWQAWMQDWMKGDDDGDWGRRGGRGRDGGPGMMWGGGMPMHSRMMPMVMMAMVDTDGNGSISYEEVEAVHRRMFNLVDKDKNGELSPDEIQSVMGGRSAKGD